MVSKDSNLKIVLYVLSEKNLINFSIKINNPGGLRFSLYPQEILTYIEA